ncbi:MAG: T9SS type A sorting domain-containing protein [Vicingus serpentipes]|nr:T9SS type A sorting domain-containing protein [Vicingus serpentipes]
MKTILLILITVVTINNQLLSQCDFEDDYSSTTGWTQVGTDVEIQNGKVEFINGAADGWNNVGPQRRVYKPLGFTLDSGDVWTADVDFNPISVGSHSGGNWVGHTILGITESGQEPLWDCPDLMCTGYPQSTTDAIIVAYQTTSTPGDMFFWIRTTDGATKLSSTGTIIANTLNTNYYLRLERTSSTNFKLSVFSDMARTVHLAGSPINFTSPSSLKGFNTVQHGNLVGYDYRRKLTGFIDNLCIKLNTPTGVVDSEINTNKISLFPNPTSNQLTLDSEMNIDEATIFDVSGQVIKSIVLNSNTIDVSELSDGVYFLRVTTEKGQIFNQKFIKQ